MELKENLTLNFKCNFKDRNSLELFSNNIRGFIEGSLQSFSKENSVRVVLSESYTKKKIVEQNIKDATEYLS